MKKLLIGALVATIILFIWQFLSFATLGLHQSDMDYTANQSEILDCLEGKLEPGTTYMLPNVPPGTANEAGQKLMEPHLGKPWARVSYRPSLNMSMGTNLFRGFVANFLAALLITWLLMQVKDIDIKKAVLACLAVGLVGYLTVTYSDSIWFENKTLPYLIDVAVSWSLVGAFLGWWLSRD